MNKTAIQKFAVWARGELLAQVKQRAYNYGVTAGGCADADAAAVGGRALTAREQALRRELVDAVQSRGYDAVAEEAAYTWFNRFAALRYVHEQQERYRTQLAHLAEALPAAEGAERVRLTKRQKQLQDQSLELQKYEEKIHHLADQNIAIDLDDGVKHNYALFGDVLARVK